MTTDELITRAGGAISTGQPKLSQLYMRKALQQIDAKRRELNPLGWQARRMVAGFRAIGDAVSNAGQAWVQAIEAVGKVSASTAAIERKSNYALVGPSK